MRKIQNILIIRSVFLVLIIFAFLYVVFLHVIHHQTQFIDDALSVTCDKTGKVVEIEITDEGFSPESTTVHTCDTVVFVNRGSVYHQVAFGDHPLHQIYPGYQEEALQKGESIQFVADIPGTYKLHDHFYEELEGEIIVNNKKN